MIGSGALQTVYFHNTVGAWLLGVLIAVLTVTALSVAKGLFLLRSAAFADRHHNGIVELPVLIVRRTWSVFLLALGIDAGLVAVTLPGGIAHGLSAAIGVVMQPAAYKVYGRFSGPLSAHMRYFADAAWAVLSIKEK